MKTLFSTARTVIVLGAIAAASVGCKQTTAPAPVDTAATTTVPDTTTTAQDTAKKTHDTVAATHNTNAGTAIGSSHTGATGAGAGDSNMKAKPAVRNNTGETQGTTPGTSLPVSDGSR